MVAVASGCKQLMVLEISGCDNITSQTRPGPVEMVASACKHSSHVAQPARLRSKITDAAMEAIALELQERGAGIMLVLYATTLFLARGHTILLVLGPTSPILFPVSCVQIHTNKRKLTHVNRNSPHDLSQNHAHFTVGGVYPSIIIPNQLFVVLTLLSL